MHSIEFDGLVFDGPVFYSGARVRVDTRRTRVLPPGWVVRPATGGESDRLDSVVPQRWQPTAVVSAEERNMPMADQTWGYLDRS